MGIYILKKKNSMTKDRVKILVIERAVVLIAVALLYMFWEEK